MNEILYLFISINLLALPSSGAPALKYGDVNTVTPSPGEVKGLIILKLFSTVIFIKNDIKFIN